MDLTKTFVLHTRAFRETSLIVEFFTLEVGKVAAVARSARGPKSRFKGLLQAFSPLLISYSGRGDLLNLRSLELTAAPYDLTGKSLFSAMYINELLMRLLPRYDPLPALFDCYQQLLVNLSGDQNTEALLRCFEKNLLSLLGYGLLLEQEADTEHDIDPAGYYLLDPQVGPLRVPHPDRDHHVFLGESLLALAAEKLDDKYVLRDAKKIMRLAFSSLLGAKPLKSRELFITIGE